MAYREFATKMRQHRTAVDDTGPAAGVGHQTELRRHHNLITTAHNGPAVQLLVGRSNRARQLFEAVFVFTETV
jgi:hypothetical protein